MVVGRTKGLSPLRRWNLAAGVIVKAQQNSVGFVMAMMDFQGKGIGFCLDE